MAFALFSSWVALFGTVAQANYVAANAWLDSQALVRRLSGRSGSALWVVPVSGNGMSVALFAQGSAAIQKVVGVVGLSLEQFATFLSSALSHPAGGKGRIAHAPSRAQY